MAIRTRASNESVRVLIPSSGKARRLPAIIGGRQFTGRSLIILFDDGEAPARRVTKMHAGITEATIFVETKSDIAIFREE